MVAPGPHGRARERRERRGVPQEAPPPDLRSPANPGAARALRRSDRDGQHVACAVLEVKPTYAHEGAGAG